MTSASDYLLERFNVHGFNDRTKELKASEKVFHLLVLIDMLALALTNEGHVWSEEERDLYEKATRC